MNAKYMVELNDEQRQNLEKITSSGTSPARQIKRAQILLKSDLRVNWSDEQISDAFDVSAMTIAKVRKTFAQHGLEAALHRKKPDREYEHALDGEAESAEVLDLSIRQVKRLLKTYRRDEAKGLVSKRRGRPSNNRLAEETRQKVLDLLKSKYDGFRPTLAHEKLVELDGLKISDESVRQLMMAERFWKAKKARKVAVHQMRERRACYGELVQIDGSPHDWFEGRAPACDLLVFIDDATGQLVQLLFVESESFFSYCRAADGYFTRYGKPGAFYSDKHGIFRVNHASAGQESGLTQFGRAMQTLDIQIICANTPQVERVIQTLQDRLPKELRLRSISSWEAGNAYLPEFMDDFNQRFAVQPRSTDDAHHPLTSRDNLAHILTWQETRILSTSSRCPSGRT
jgi:transposase